VGRMPAVRGGSVFRVAVLALLWGSGFLWTKLALRGFTPEQVVLGRLALGALVLLAVLRLVKQRLPQGRMTWFHLTLAAATGNVIPYLMMSVGLREVDSAVAGMINATTPVWTVLIALAARQGQRFSLVVGGGVVTGLAGTILIFAPWQLGSQFTSAGAMACLVAAFSYGISYVYLARFLTNRGNGPLGLSAGQLLVASALTALVLPFGGLHPPQWQPDAVISLLILGILGTGAAFVVNYRIVTDDGAIAGSAVIYLLPAVAIILGALVLDEQPTSHALLGVLVVLIGVTLTRWPGARATREPHAAGTGPTGAGPASGQRFRSRGSDEAELQSR
jgi:drug/metabolite transporter (DMT)-like permease